MTEDDVVWVQLDLPDLEAGRVTTVVAGGRALCVAPRPPTAGGRSTTAARTRAGRWATASSRTAT